MLGSDLYEVARYPVLTEKTTKLNEDNKYAFYVEVGACKKVIKKAVESVFDVKVSAVNVMNVSGKVKKFKGRDGKKADRKKAIVTLFEGYSIDVFGNID